jgi:2-oxoisovalerate dehydrogenase E1 component
LAVYAPPTRPAAVAPGWQETAVPRERLVHALKDCLAVHLRRDPGILLLGEDIESPYGGAFKATQGLSGEFRNRVRNTPISEAGIVGFGAGLALAGWRPVVEIMFGDFTGLAFDQLVNHAAKFERMYHGQVCVDLVVRTPMGGRRGYGPTHSQTLDRHFIGAPGLRVLALNNLLPPDALYGPLLAGHSGATLVIENKLAYGTFLRAEYAPGFRMLLSDERFPTAWLRPEAQVIDVTLLGYGGMSDLLVTVAERLFGEHDLVAQVLCPMQIYPFDIDLLLPVLRRSPRLLVVEEGQGFAGFGAEVVAQLAEHAPELGTQFARVAPPGDIIPSSGTMEKAMLPSCESIIARAVALCT